MNYNEEFTSPERNLENFEFDYSAERKNSFNKKGEMELLNNLSQGNNILPFLFGDAFENADEVISIPIDFSKTKKTEKTVKKLYVLEEYITPIKKTGLNEYFKYVFSNFFTKKELLKFIKFALKENDFEFTIHLELRKANKNCSKEALGTLCTKVMNILAYK